VLISSGPLRGLFAWLGAHSCSPPLTHLAAFLLAREVGLRLGGSDGPARSALNLATPVRLLTAFSELG